MFDCFDEENALAEKNAIINAFLDRHSLHDSDWYSVMERGYLKASFVFDIDDPLFPKIAYWLMRHEMYCKRRESSMGRKINYPSFAWSKKRQATLKELCQEGKSIPEIAAHFEVDESVICQRIDKYGFARTIREPPEASDPIPAAPALPQQEEVPLPAPAMEPTLKPERPSKTIYIDRPHTDIHTLLKDLLHYVVDSNNHNNDTMAALDENKSGQACFELGQQCAKLSEAEKIIKNLLTTFPEP